MNSKSEMNRKKLTEQYEEAAFALELDTYLESEGQRLWEAYQREGEPESWDGEIPELTAEILRIFIKRVEVGEREEKYSRNASQEIRIYYRDIGLVDELPQSMTAGEVA